MFFSFFTAITFINSYLYYILAILIFMTIYSVGPSFLNLDETHKCWAIKLQGQRSKSKCENIYFYIKIALQES